MIKFILHTLVVTLFFSFTLSGCEFDKIKSKAITGNLDIDVDENIEPLMKKKKRSSKDLTPKLNCFYLQCLHLIASQI